LVGCVNLGGLPAEPLLALLLRAIAGDEEKVEEEKKKRKGKNKIKNMRKKV